MITEHPILFSGEMVRAILDGRKTQTRRVAKRRDKTGTYSLFNDDASDGVPLGWPMTMDSCGYYLPDPCPYGVPGDRLWVRETWAHTNDYDGQFLLDGVRALYKATPLPMVIPSRWRPSIHMPRRASRLTLEITDVRIQRLQDITEDDATAEGCNLALYQKYAGTDVFWPCPKCNGRQTIGGKCCTSCDTAVKMFSHLWDSINAKRGCGWESNCWVWVITFKTT